MGGRRKRGEKGSTLHIIFGYVTGNNYKMFNYCRETVLQGGLVMTQSGRLELRYNIERHYRSVFNQCDVISRQSNRIQ